MPDALRAARCQRLAAPLTTFVLNLDHDRDRLARAKHLLEDLPGLVMRRIPGVMAADLPQAARAMLRGTPEAPGNAATLGVFLGHMAIWEAVAQTGDWALVVEDDFLMTDSAWLWGLDLPLDAELVFANTAGDPFRGEAPLSAPSVLPLTALWTRFRKPDLERAQPGAFGYLLHAEGARKLLAAVMRDGCRAHVDWRMLFYGLPVGALGDLTGHWLESRHRNQGVLTQAVVRGYCISPGQVSHGGFASTRLRQERG